MIRNHTLSDAIKLCTMLLTNVYYTDSAYRKPCATVIINANNKIVFKNKALIVTAT